MSYNILETNIEFENGNIDTITVLVEMSENDIRAIQANTQPRGGYMNISPGAKLNEELLQEIAGYGMQVNASQFFPKSKYLKV
ncbi:hypothetical protein SAMN04489761_3442 [Tenacibaculum sp. MAR_2009_124]|uniref:hypothetical protein n=1 Tax=Tenacibaculum sp. MAR_2009_124 TaxID=1250059 RepID=UPI0008962307|nr:hypothetical protein [Tenacibaculum sp. MAR_2009_124]SEC66552.1 hypothetical protein SAMN04489761_3442 [Tenacibaculum sp. MAR_2009_124]